MRPPGAPPERPPRVLIVDDERANRDLLTLMLSPEGYEIATARSGAEALEQAKGAERPHIILLDVMMAGMDGYEVAARLKADPSTGKIPIIMVTALDGRDARLRGLTAGVEDFLTKPVDRAELCVRVRNLLRLKTYTDYCDNYSAMLEREVAARTAELVLRTTALEAQAGVLTEQAALLDLAQDAIVVRDMAGVILFWSRGAEALYGWPAAEAIGRKAADLLRIAPSPVEEGGKRVLLNAGRWEGEEVHHQRDGRPVTVASRWALQYDEQGAPMRILTINNDISGRKMAETERTLLTERLSLATSVARVGVWDWDLASDTVTWDATMFEIYGLPFVVPMPYRAWSGAIVLEDRAGAEAALQLTIASKGEGASEYRIMTPDGTVRTIAAAQRVLLDDHERVLRVIGVNMDVTERKQAERAREQSRNDQMRFKDEFLSHVSHELRSPLTAIKQFSSILHDGLAGELNPEQRQYQEIVLKNVAQLQAMIDDLLEVTRLETGKLTVDPVSTTLAESVTDAMNTLEGPAAARKVRLVASDTPPGLPPAFADATRVRQVLIILLDNAVKFSGEGDTVTVGVRKWEEDPSFLLVEVRDTGSGIDPQMADQLFERLYQAPSRGEASRKGLGLGLFIARELVTRQGGRIWARPGTAGGTTVSFTVPAFSLAKVISPLLKDGRWPAESVALIHVAVSAGLRSSEEWLRHARGVLNRCLLPDLDVLLPQPAGVALGLSFFVAAFATEGGATVLTRRLRLQFQRHVQLGVGQSIHVSHVMLAPATDPEDQSEDQRVEAMAERLAESIRVYTSAEGVVR